MRADAVRADTAASEYLGGYDVIPPEGISSAGSTFTMPKITCPDTGVFQLDSLGEWVNNSSGDMYQDGGDTDAISAAVIECNDGAPVYGIDALTANGPDSESFAVSPGNRIQTRVEELASGDALATTTDLTTGQAESSQGTSLGDESQIYEGFVPDIYDETFAGSDSIVKFKSVLFTRSQIGSVPLAQVGPTATDLVQTGPVMVAPSAIAAKTPGRFTVTEKSTQ